MLSHLEETINRLSLLCPQRRSVIREAILNTEKYQSEIWECGCYKGGTALYMTQQPNISARKIRVFDTFCGLPNSESIDIHKIGDMSVDYVETFNLLTPHGAEVIKGSMPDSFAGLEDCSIGVAHIDVDQYRSVKEILEWIYPRVHLGGYVIIDDYNCLDCPGAKKAVDEFMLINPIVKETFVVPGRPNPQAYFIKK